ncbi:unnamed protein product [Rotaria socialis]|uniref:Uncharacterized protein n=3 Tax=Rotaria socialis TaxID=392032 RepID=A0A818SH45_9BILA|nr:unnamed protein product [Rotaria socialis]
MSESRENLSTMVEIGARSSLKTIKELESCDDDQSFEEFRQLATKLKVDTNRFLALCDNVRHCLSRVDNSTFEILELKDKLLLQFLPLNVSLRITFVLSQFFRAYSEAHIPINELVRLTELYSEPFDIKSVALKKLCDSNETKGRLLKLAFQQLTSMEVHTKKYQDQKNVNHWEKMYIRLALPRANTRKWKFRIKTFREEARLGYEHVIQWLHGDVPQPMKELIDDEYTDQFNSTDELITMVSASQQMSQNDHVCYDEDTEIFLSSSIIEESKLIESKSMVMTVDAENQIRPDVDDQQTSTQDILSTKALIMRFYRPIGMDYSKFQYFVHAQGQIYKTNIFKAANDRRQADELMVAMPSSFKRRSLFHIDQDSIKIDVFGDDKFCGSLNISSEDLRMLDLPNLHNSVATDNDASLLNHQHDFDQRSSNIYQSWISRTPQLFSIYDPDDESIGKLPLLMFWYNKTEQTHSTKSTMTIPMDFDESTSKVTSTQHSEVTESVTMSVSTKTTNDNFELNISEIVDDPMELLKTAYENEITKIHENYQAEIYRLTNLLNGLLSQPPTEENHFENISEETVVEQPSLPNKFLNRYKMHTEKSTAHRRELITKIEQETTLANERQMEMQHRLYKPKETHAYNDDLCLPAVFMPFRSGHIFNPRAYQFFHSIGSTNPRLTQAPTILKLPPLPSGSVSVLNLFELSQRYDNSNEKT